MAGFELPPASLLPFSDVCINVPCTLIASLDRSLLRVSVCVCKAQSSYQWMKTDMLFAWETFKRFAKISSDIL